MLFGNRTYFDHHQLILHEIRSQYERILCGADCLLAFCSARCRLFSTGVLKIPKLWHRLVSDQTLSILNPLGNHSETILKPLGNHSETILKHLEPNSKYSAYVFIVQHRTARYSSEITRFQHGKQSAVRCDRPLMYL